MGCRPRRSENTLMKRGLRKKKAKSPRAGSTPSQQSDFGELDFASHGVRSRTDQKNFFPPTSGTHRNYGRITSAENVNDVKKSLFMCTRRNNYMKLRTSGKMSTLFRVFSWFFSTACFPPSPRKTCAGDYLFFAKKTDSKKDAINRKRAINAIQTNHLKRVLFDNYSLGGDDCHY